MTVLPQRELALPGGTLVLRASAASDRGSVRRVNEDSFFARLPVYLVADGMGGHQFGDIASQTVASTFAGAFPDEVPTHPEAVLDAIRQAHAAVVGLIDETHPPGSVAGTTVTGVVLVEGASNDAYSWMAFNVGDSRVYSWDGRALTQLTVDHSAVQELVNRGLISPSEAAVHPERNVITRAVGAGARVEADVRLIPLGVRQVFLACSDGLNKELDDTQIATILAEYGRDAPDASSIADRLVDAAIASGGRDNVTVVVVEAEFQSTGVDADHSLY